MDSHGGRNRRMLIYRRLCCWRGRRNLLQFAGGESALPIPPAQRCSRSCAYFVHTTDANGWDLPTQFADAPTPQIPGAPGCSVTVSSSSFSNCSSPKKVWLPHLRPHSSQTNKHGADQPLFCCRAA